MYTSRFGTCCMESWKSPCHRASHRIWTGNTEHGQETVTLKLCDSVVRACPQHAGACGGQARDSVLSRQPVQDTQTGSQIAACLSTACRRIGGQVQYSLLDRRPENGMADFCAQHGMALLPYGTTAGGLLSERYLGLPASRRGCASVQGCVMVHKSGCAHEAQPLQRVQPGA